jgi:hypothetical protein
MAIALFLALAVPGTSQAINFCTSAQADCATIELAPNQTGVSLQLWLNSEATDSIAMGGNMTASGSTSFTARANGSDLGAVGGCDWSGVPGQLFGWACGTGGTIASGASYQLAILTVDTGAVGDTIILTSGTYLTPFFSQLDVENAGQTLVTIVPEPGAVVLLGAGLAGLAFLRRKRA